MAPQQNQQTIIRKFLRSEITWTASIFISLWFFVTTVVLPIQALQINVTKIQEQLSSESDRYAKSDDRIAALEQMQAVIVNKLAIKE